MWKSFCMPTREKIHFDHCVNYIFNINLTVKAGCVIISRWILSDPSPTPGGSRHHCVGNSHDLHTTLGEWGTFGRGGVI